MTVSTRLGLPDRRANQGNRVSPVTAVNAKVRTVYGDNTMAWMEFAHADETEIGEVRLPICVPLGESSKRRKVLVEREGNRNQSLLDHRQDNRRIAEVERRFGQHGLAGEEGFGDTAGHADSPVVVPVVAIGKRHEKAGIGDAFHVREKPFRADRPRSPRTVPARRINDWDAAPFRALTSWSRMILP